MIYLLEDDDSIRELVIYTLTSQGMEAAGFSHPSEFWEAMRSAPPSLLLLDIMLPEEDGIHILKKLRSSPSTKRLPIIMLTAKGSEYDTVLGLDSGADDYIPKPFRMMELLSRIRALLRRSSEEPSPTEYRLGKLMVNPQKHVVQVDGQDVVLTLKEFELLSYLMEHMNRVVTRDELLDNIWGYDYDGETRTLDMHIKTLRQKLKDAGQQIKTVRGVGYRFLKEKER